VELAGLEPGGAPLEAVSGICELVLETEDGQRLEGFYNWLGLETLQRSDDRIWLAVGGRSRLGIWSPGRKEHGDRGGRHDHFAISAQRRTIDRVASALRAEGMEVEGPIEHPGGDRSL
jgi:catechol-2,3-dioxygenase